MNTKDLTPRMKFKIAGATCIIADVEHRGGMALINYVTLSGYTGRLVIEEDHEFDILVDNDPRYRPCGQFRIKKTDGSFLSNTYSDTQDAEMFLYLGGPGATIQQLHRKKPMFLWMDV